MYNEKQCMRPISSSHVYPLIKCDCIYYVNYCWDCSVAYISTCF